MADDEQGAGHTDAGVPTMARTASVSRPGQRSRQSSGSPDEGAGTTRRYAKARRTGRACDACAKVKMRCITSHEGVPPCQRCSRQGYDCTFANAEARSKTKSSRASTAQAEAMPSTSTTAPQDHNHAYHQPVALTAQTHDEVSNGHFLTSFPPDGHTQTGAHFEPVHSLHSTLAPASSSSWVSNSLPAPSGSNAGPAPGFEAFGSMITSGPSGSASITSGPAGPLPATANARQSTFSEGGPVTSMMTIPNSADLGPTSSIFAAPDYNSGNAGGPGSASGSGPGSEPSAGGRFPPQHLRAASTPSASSPRTKDVKQLTNPLGLLVFASLDLSRPGSTHAASIPAGASTSAAAGTRAGPAANAVASTSDASRLLERESLEQSSGGSITRAADHEARAPREDSSEDDDPTQPKAQDVYFRPASQSKHATQSQRPPAAYGIFSVDEVQELFKIFFDNFHVHAPIFDKEHNSPQEVAERSHFLFHAICAIAMRGWTGPSDKQAKMLKIISAHLRLLPRERTLGCVQANLLCATWNPVSPQHVDLDEQYLRVGLAVRLAMDLRLHEADVDSESSLPLWILRDQRRTWALCYIFESKLSAHRQQPCLISTWGLDKLEANGSTDDQRMLSSVEWCRIVARINADLQVEAYSRESISPQAHKTVSLSRCDEIDAELLDWKDRWVTKFADFPTGLQVLLARTRLYYHYARLLNYAHGLQTICEVPDWTDTMHASKYLDAVVRMLYTFVEDFGAHRIATYLSDLHFTCIAFSAVSLIHSITIGLGRQSYHTASSVRLIDRVADIFEASSGKYGHNLRNQASFLRAVLRAKLTDDGKPRGQAVVKETDWNSLGMEGFFFDPQMMQGTDMNDAWGMGGGTFAESDPLAAYLNAGSIFSNADAYDSALWDSILQSTTSLYSMQDSAGDAQ